MNKPIALTDVEYAMLQELSKRSRLKPEQYLKKVIQDAYKILK